MSNVSAQPVTTTVSPPAETVVGAPAATTTPTITLNNSIGATVLGTVLSPGSAGLYQINIQLPNSTPSGNVSIQASVGGVQSPTGINIFVGN